MDDSMSFRPDHFVDLPSISQMGYFAGITLLRGRPRHGCSFEFVVNSLALLTR
jgi:hypothetical protein